MVASLVKRTVGSQTQETPPHSRDPQSEEEENHGQDEEEDDQQSHLDRVRFWTEGEGGQFKWVHQRLDR